MDSDHETADPQAGTAAAPAPKTRVMACPAETGTPLIYLLKMADEYLAAGDLHQAVEIYFSIIDDDPEAGEAAMARKHLLEIGRRYQQTGEPHQARSIYERLL